MSVSVFMLKKRPNDISVMHDTVPIRQLKSTSHAGTLAQPPPVCRTLKRPFTKQEKRWLSPATPATSCRVKPPSTVSLGIHHSGITLLPPAEVNQANGLHIWKYNANQTIFYIFALFANTKTICFVCFALCYTTLVQILINLQLCLCSILNPICERTQGRWWVMFFKTLCYQYIVFIIVHISQKCVCFFLVVVNVDYGMGGTNVALAVFIPTAVILVVVLGIYVYFAK